MSNVPKLRFREFDESWDTLSIGETLEIKSGKDQKKVECIDGKYPILGTGGEIGRTNQYLYNKESVLIGRKGTIDKPMYKDTPFWTVDTLFYSEIKELHSAKFLYYAFQKINWKKYCEATGVPSLSKSIIEKIKYNIPSLPEQEKIASFLSLYDKKIELQEKKIASLEKYKKGMMQKIFSQELRFKDENGENYPEWKEKKIKDIIIPAKKSKYSSSDAFENGLYPFFINNAVDKYKFFNEAELNGKYIIANTGGSAYFKYYDGAFSYMSDCFVFSTNEIEKFIYYTLKYKESYINYNGFRGNGLKHLDKKWFNKLKVKLPSIPEQEKIASLLSTIDKKIELEEKLLEKLKEYKKGLLQQMFV